MRILKEWLASFKNYPRILLIFPLLFLQIVGLITIAVGSKDWAPLLVPISVAIWLIWFAILFWMLSPAADNWLKKHIKPLIGITISLGLILCLVFVFEVTGIALLETGKLKTDGGSLESADKYVRDLGYNDGTALIHMAGKDLLEGKNPYAGANIFEAFDEFGMSSSKVTPLRQGNFADIWPYPTDEEIDIAWQEAKADNQSTALEFEGKLSYPAGSFLFVSPFIALGLNDLRYFYVLCMLLVFAVILWRTPKKLWPLVVLVALASIEWWNELAAGGATSLYLLFLLLGWILLKKNVWISAIFMGLAATSKQPAWFFILFYLVLIFRTIGWKRCFQVIMVIGAIFLATNIPFIISGPQIWLKSVLAPMIDPMFPKGVGIVNFSIAELIPSDMSMIYAAAEVIALLVCLIWYWYKCGKYPDSGLALAVIPFFFAWRSFSIYMSTAALLVFTVVLISCRSPALPATDVSK